MLTFLLLLALLTPGDVGASTTAPRQPGTDDDVHHECTTSRTTVRVMVLDLLGDGDGAAIAKTLGPVIAREAALAPGHTVITNEDLRAVLDQEAQKQIMGCTESACLAEFADALDADLLVSGRVDVGDAPTISLSLLNTRALVTVNRVSMTWPGPRERLTDVARAASMLLMLEKSRRPPGKLAIEGAPDEATVFVDGEDWSTKRDGLVLDGVEIGTHVVRIEADGYEPKETNVLVMSGETTRIDGALDGRPLYASPWVWTGVGAAVVVTFVGTVAAFAALQDANVSTSSTITAPTILSVEDVK